MEIGREPEVGVLGVIPATEVGDFLVGIFLVAGNAIAVKDGLDKDGIAEGTTTRDIRLYLGWRAFEGQCLLAADGSLHLRFMAPGTHQPLTRLRVG